jgi:hypothetical protein
MVGRFAPTAADQGERSRSAPQQIRASAGIKVNDF